MSDQLPAIVQPGALTAAADTYIVPALIADAGDAAGWRYVEFFTANIRNPHTRRAYARACGRFLRIPTKAATYSNLIAATIPI
jgi:hypothetical protein